MRTGSRAAVTDLVAAIEAVPDPEVPVVTIADLGILRSVDLDEAAGTATVVITPTYSGCPAMEAIRSHVEHVCRDNGWEPTVVLRLAPPWTTDWVTDDGADKLRAFGIAPPTPSSTVSLTLQRHVVTCPQCGSDDTEVLARFGSTACKALRRCLTCREPFDEFKTI